MILRSLFAGLSRILRFPALFFWILGANLVVAIPLAVAMRDVLRQSIGHSLAHENLRSGFDTSWYGEFNSSATGIGKSFGPEVVGILPLARNVEMLLEGELWKLDRTILGAGILYLLAWCFFAGGILQHYANPGTLYARGQFFWSSATYFFRFVRLLAISIAFYGAIFRWVVRPLHERLVDATRDVTVERTVLIYTLVVYLLAGLLLTLMGMALDYAKAAMVIENRRSAVLASIRGLGFVLSHPIRTFSLYGILLAVGIVILAGYAVIAPGPGQSTVFTVFVAFALAQVYVGAKIFLKLWFLASQTVLFVDVQERELPPAAEAAAVAA